MQMEMEHRQTLARILAGMAEGTAVVGRAAGHTAAAAAVLWLDDNGGRTLCRSSLHLGLHSHSGSCFVVFGASAARPAAEGAE